MKKYKFKKMYIPAPCNEDWDQMTPMKEGRHCTSCKKEVYDFTKMNETEFNAFVQKKGEDICGIFRNDQLNQEYRFEPKSLPNKWQRIWQYSRSLAAVFIFKIGIINTAQAIGNKANVEWVDSTNKNIDNRGKISGKVLRASEKESGIYNATVKLKLKNGKVIMTTTTNSEGEYSFKLPADFDKNQTYWIEVSKDKYKSRYGSTKYITVSTILDTKNINNANVFMPVKTKTRRGRRHTMGVPAFR